MQNHNRAMYLFAQLAAISQEKQQLNQATEFLLLAGLEAVQADLPDLSARCRQLISINHPRHLVCKHDDLKTASEDPDFENFMKRLNKFCTFEKAEHLLQELELPTHCQDDADYALGTFAILSGPSWEGA